MSKIIPENRRLWMWLSVIMVAWVACTPSNQYPAKQKRDEIHFGQGGGFSGAVTHYILLEDGRLFQKAWRDTSVSYVDTWPGLFTRQMFLNYASLKLDTITCQQPGDLYYFVEYHSKKKEPHRIVWGKPGYYPPENLVRFYTALYRYTKPNS